MQTNYAKSSLQVRGSSPRLTGALLFADIADASGGRIAVFYRDGLVAFELCERQGGKNRCDDVRARDAVLDKDDGRW
ncbi:MAG: hypothetical protein WC809_15615 [Sinimarinibacterium sp.]